MRIELPPKQNTSHFLQSSQFQHSWTHCLRRVPTGNRSSQEHFQHSWTHYINSSTSRTLACRRARIPAHPLWSGQDATHARHHKPGIAEASVESTSSSSSINKTHAQLCAHHTIRATPTKVARLLSSTRFARLQSSQILTQAARPQDGAAPFLLSFISTRSTPTAEGSQVRICECVNPDGPTYSIVGR